MSDPLLPPAPALTPALTAEQWKQSHLVVQAERYGEDDMPSRDCGAAEIHVGPDYLSITSHEYGTIAVIDTPEQRHALAALCLYDRDFGFSPEEADHLDGMRQRVYGHDEVLYSLVQKIRALLPPQP